MPYSVDDGSDGAELTVFNPSFDRMLTSAGALVLAEFLLMSIVYYYAFGYKVKHCVYARHCRAV